MAIEVFQDDGSGAYDSVIADAQRHRHEVFVEQMGWENLRRPDGRERDQFDDEHAVHIVVREDGEIAAYSRMLPTTRPHLIDSVYPELLKGAEPVRGPKVWEWTRSSVVPSRAEGAAAFSPAAAKLFLAITEWTLHNGVEALSVQFHPIYMTRMMQLGWHVRPLALESVVDGQPVVPLVAYPTEKALPIMRAFFGIDRPVLDLEEPERSTSGETRRIGSASGVGHG